MDIVDDRNFYPELDYPPPPRQKENKTNMTVNDDGVGLDEESGLTEHDLMELDKPPPQPESQELKKPLMANYKNWAGRNTFLCNAKLVSGPRDQIVPSLIVHCILLSVIFVWSTACIPFLLERG